ncbi:MAG: hypothetical protein IT210_11710 [Armatimonadetes bacterium]|nr:hypothetical protein [Armatimonadota bacterium]
MKFGCCLKVIGMVGLICIGVTLAADPYGTNITPHDWGLDRAKPATWKRLVISGLLDDRQSLIAEYIQDSQGRPLGGYYPRSKQGDLFYYRGRRLAEKHHLENVVSLVDVVRFAQKQERSRGRCIYIERYRYDQKRRLDRCQTQAIRKGIAATDYYYIYNKQGRLVKETRIQHPGNVELREKRGNKEVVVVRKLPYKRDDLLYAPTANGYQLRYLSNGKPLTVAYQVTLDKMGRIVRNKAVEPHRDSRPRYEFGSYTEYRYGPEGIVLKKRVDYPRLPIKRPVITPEYSQPPQVTQIQYRYEGKDRYGNWLRRYQKEGRGDGSWGPWILNRQRTITEVPEREKVSYKRFIQAN